MINIVNSIPRFSQHNEQAIVARMLERLAPREHFCVDIAAHNGVVLSNTLPIFMQGWGGLAVEADPELFAGLARNYVQLGKVGLARCYATPMNIVPLLQAFSTPREFGYLSLDIDSYDYYVLAQLLAAYRPSLIVSEVNEIIPPPVKFTVKYNPDFSYKNDNFQGQSLAMLMELAGRHNYDLVEVEYNNAFLIPREINPFPVVAPEQAWRAGYLERTDRAALFPWNAKHEPLFQMDAARQVEYLRGIFAQYAGGYELGL